MPYIKAEDKSIYETIFKQLETMTPAFKTAGELNYFITKIIHLYQKNKGLNYQTINDIIGALESAKAEYQRRVVNPYEDLKIQQNGDVE